MHLLVSFCPTQINVYGDTFCSVGSMLALDSPYIANSEESAMETSEKICLEYGSATLIYLVPFIQKEEQVSN